MIRVEDLAFSYNGNDVIYGVDLDVKRGELVSLLGPNGSGKTTILKCLNGVLNKKQGKVLIDNQSLAELKQKKIARLISVVPQEHNLIFSYGLLEFVAMGVTPYLSFGRMPTKGDYSKALEILKELGLESLADRRFNQLSGGEKQLVLIARALMQETDYMLMDEPTSHLDFKNRHRLMQELRKITAVKEKGVLTALHDPNLALKFCDRVVLLKNGTVLEQGPVKQVINNYNLEKVYEVEVTVNSGPGGQRVDII